MTKVCYRNISGTKIDMKTVNTMKKSIITAVEDEYPEHIFEVSVTVCNDEYIHALNKEYRNKDKATDVLSFPMLDFGSPQITTLLGDIVISADTALRQAELYGHSPLRELCFLSVHSALHLLGYDHEDDDESRLIMENKQKEILKRLGI